MLFLIEEKIKQVILSALKSLAKKNTKLTKISIILEHPANSDFGDYSSNIAMTSFKNFEATNPREFAQSILDKISENKPQFIDQINIAGPGFINFTLSNNFLLNILQQIIDQGKNFAQLKLGADKQIMVEFAHPNTHKIFHIGHLRNISTGESLVRILKNAAYDVIRANYQGDVGLHIAKCLYGILSQDHYQQKLNQLKSLDEKIEFIGKAYVNGSTAYRTDKKTQDLIHDLNYLVYAAAQKYQQEVHGQKPGSTDYLKFLESKQYSLEEIYPLWVQTRQWSLDFFETIYHRVGSNYDKYYFESQCLNGVDLARQALAKGILKESDGAIIFDGSKYKLDNRVFINSLGLPTYEGKELSLATTQFAKHPGIEKIIHVVAPEQTSFFAVTFKVEELLNIIKPGQQYHKKYGFVNLKSGKMSSRTGNIVTGQNLLDEAKGRIINNFPDIKEETAEILAVAAVKYSFLKVNTNSDIAFDFEESISLEGNSGPYLLYTYARSQSVLRKAKDELISLDLEKVKIDDLNNFELAEKSALRLIYQFPEVLDKATQFLEPHHLAGYLYNLAQSFNSFYNKCSILNAEDKKQIKFRLMLTDAVGVILQKGLYLLGIKTVQQI